MSIASRITEMEQHIGNAYDKIEDLGIDLTDVDKNINNISSMLENVWDEYPKVSATDVEEASLNGTKKGRMEIDLKGQTSQATTILPLEYQQVEYIQSSGVEYIDSGYQLNSNTSKIIIKSKTINGLNKFRCLFGYENDYTNRFFLRFSTDNSGFLYAPNNRTINNMQIDNINNIEIDISNNKTKCNGIETATSINIKKSSLPLFIFTLNYQGSPASDNFLTMQLYTFQVYENNNIVRNLIPCYRKSDNEIGLYDLVTKTFLTNQGTGTFTKGNDVTIPNPDFPQPIKNVTGNNNIKIQNKNLLNIERELGEPTSTDFANTTKRFFNYNTYVKGITGANNYSSSAVKDVVIEDNNVSFTTVNGYYGLGFPIKVKPNTNYYFSVTELSANSLVRIMFYDKDGTYLSNVNKGSFTTPSNCDCILVFLTGSQANTTYNFTNLQIELGSTATDFVEHQEQNYPFTLGDIELNKIDTAQDYFYKNNDKWYLHKEIDKVVFNGSSNVDVWGNVTQVGTSSFYRFANSAFNDTTKYKSLTPYISDKFIFDNVNSLQEKNIISNTGATGVNRLWITIDTTLMNGATVEDFKTWLSTHNTEVYYQLATPIDIEITETTLINQLDAIKQAKSYNDQTNILQTNDELPFILDIEALKGETTNEVKLLTSNNRKTAEYLESSLEPEEVEKLEEERVDTEENTESTAENVENSAEREEEQWMKNTFKK